MRDAMIRIGRVHPRDVDQVRDDGARRGLGAGTCAVIERRADRIAFDEHRVHRAFDVGDQTLRRYQRWMHAKLDAVFRAARDRQQLDAVTQFLGVAKVLAGELRNTFGIGLFVLHRHAEGNRRHDRQLMRGVDAFDVEGGIGLRVSAHFGQYEIGRAVDDAGDPLDPVGGQSFAQRFDDRNAAGDRRLERDHHALVRRRCEDFVAVLREQCLVRGDDVLAPADRVEHHRARGLDAADQLAHDVDIGMAHDDGGIVGEIDTIDAARAVSRAIERARGDPGDADRPSRAARDLLFVAAEHVEHTLADGAEADQPHLQRLHCGVGHYRSPSSRNICLIPLIA